MPTNKPTGQSRRFTTAAELKSLKPESRPYEASDGKREGLRLRVRPSGARTWWYVYREPGADGRQGKVHRVRLGDYPAMGLEPARNARDEWAGQRGAAGKADPHEVISAQAEEKAARAAQEAAQAARGVWTVERLAGVYVDALRASKRRERTVAEIERQLKRDVFPAIGDTPADAVTVGDLEALLAKVAKRGSTRQRNAIRVTLVGLYSWATGTRRRALAADPPKHMRGGANPAAAVAVIDHRPSRERRPYTESELRTLWGALRAARGEVYADALALLFLCGTRAQETVSARWRDIDLEAGTWTIPGAVTKNRQAHRVLLSSQAIDLLRDRAKATKGRGYVFPQSGTAEGYARADTLRHRLTEILEEHKIDRTLTAHEARHTFLTHVVGKLRLPQEVRRRVANHTSGDALERVYVHHSYDEEARSAWARWGAYLDAKGGKVVKLRPEAGA